MIMAERRGAGGLFRRALQNIGFARLLLGLFLILLLVISYFQGQAMHTLISDILLRVGMNGILVLAMVPSIQSGTGPNFALPVGIVCGLLGIVTSIEAGFTGWICLSMAIVIALPIAVFSGYIYGRLLNAVRGAEMTIATYTGFSVVALSSLAWLMIPFKNTNMGWFMGKGLRETIQLDAVGASKILSGFLSFEVLGVAVPTGLLLFFGMSCIAVTFFQHTKTGIAISAGGMNPRFSMSIGLDINRNRVIANILSNVLGAAGIIIYAQSYGYAQLYGAPLMMAFPAVAAVLIGGATPARAKVSHVVIGVILFQGLLTVSLPVTNYIFSGADLSEIMRIVVQNGIILYALTQIKGRT
jgi:simple sugar transport system permease protein